MWRDHILVFLATLLTYPPSARRFIQAGGVEYLTTYMAQSHSGVEERLQVRKQSVPPDYARPRSASGLNFLDEFVEAASGDGASPSAASSAVETILDEVVEPMRNGQISDLCIELLDTLLDRIPRLRKSIAKSKEFQVGLWPISLAV
jgi:hypothetical protein